MDALLVPYASGTSETSYDFALIAAADETFASPGTGEDRRLALDLLVHASSACTAGSDGGERWGEVGSYLVIRSAISG